MDKNTYDVIAREIEKPTSQYTEELESVDFYVEKKILRIIKVKIKFLKL